METIDKKWSPDDDDYQDFPKHLLKRVLDSDDRVLFGSRWIKGLVQYSYIPGEYMTNGIDFIISSSCSYDGVGLAGVDQDKEEIMAYSDLTKRFTANKYANQS